MKKIPFLLFSLITSLVFSSLFLMPEMVIAEEAEEMLLEEVLDGFDDPVENSTENLSEEEWALDGFEDTETDRSSEKLVVHFEPEDQNSADSGNSESETPFSLRGYIQAALSYNVAHDASKKEDQTDFRGFSKLAQKVWLEAESDLGEDWKLHVDGHLQRDLIYREKGRENYAREVLDAYEEDAEWGEAWVRGALASNIDLKVGRQIVPWGYADYLRVVDAVNPMDLREPGLGDLETMRLPVGAVKLDVYEGDWRVSLLAALEWRLHKTAPCGSDFYRDGLKTQAECDQLTKPIEEPEDGMDDASVAINAEGRFEGWDIALYQARLNHDTPYLDLQKNTLRYPRIHLTGTAVSVADGNWLWKGEAARLGGLRFAGVDAEKSRYDLLFGGEYSGFTDTTLAFEAVSRHIQDYEDGIEQSGWNQKMRQLALSFQRDFANDTHHFSVTLIRDRWDLNRANTILRIAHEYDVNDEISVKGGAILYESDGKKYNYENSDRAFLETRYSF